MNIEAILVKIAIVIIPLIFAITVHEAAHGWMANKFGDDTARNLGRITLNPIKHIDPIGTVIVPLIMVIISNFIFGYAKPVPVDWNKLRHPRRDMALVALAGPGANFVMALIWAAIAKATLGNSGSLPYIHATAIFGIHINILLLLLNLIPIPPLDGSRVITSLLPPRAAMIYNAIEPYGIWILLLLLVSGALTLILMPQANYSIGIIKQLFGIP